MGLVFISPFLQAENTLHKRKRCSLAHPKKNNVEQFCSKCFKPVCTVQYTVSLHSRVTNVMIESERTHVPLYKLIHCFSQAYSIISIFYKLILFFLYLEMSKEMQKKNLIINESYM